MLPKLNQEPKYKQIQPQYPFVISGHIYLRSRK